MAVTTRFSCRLCGGYYSVRAMADHVVGAKHRTLLALVSPEEVKQLGRLQYLINTHMKEEPFLGLEYVVETPSYGSYIYTCTLCNVQKNRNKMVYHIINVEHMEKYIYTHHRSLYDQNEYPSSPSKLHALGKVAQLIYDGYGNKEIQVESSACSQDQDTVSGHSSEEDGMKNGTLLAVDDALQTEFAQEGPINNCNEKKDLDSCNICDVIFHDPIVIRDHVLGTKHYKMMQLKAPNQVAKHNSLNFILNTYYKEVPILGLEYVSELKEGSLYKFSCQMCNVECNLHTMLNHILGVEHTRCYIKKHHANLYPPHLHEIKKGKRSKVLRDVSIKILKSYGRKDIMLKNITVDDSAVLKPFQGGDAKTSKASEDKEADMLLNKHNSQSSSQAKKRPSPCQESHLDKGSKGNSQVETVEKSEMDGPSLAKRGKLLPEDEQDALPGISGYNGSHLCMTSEYIPGLECTTAEQGFEFRSNNQFYEYLAEFEIKDNKDAIFIQKVAKNCFQALKYFQE